MVRYAVPGGMLGEMSRHWWVAVLRGAAAVVFGTIALVWPGLTLVALALVFGIFALFDGVALGFVAYRAGPGNRTALLVQSVLGILVGTASLVWPLAAVIALVYVIGAWAVITGAAEIVTAVRLRARISSEWLLIFVGALSVVFGLLLWFWPLEGAQAIVFVIGVYAVIFGVALAAAGFRVRGAGDTAQTSTSPYGTESGEPGGPETAPQEEPGSANRGDITDGRGHPGGAG